MSIFPRPLKKVLDKIIPFSQEDKVPTFNLGTGTADNTTFLRGDGTWATPSGGSGSIPHGTASGTDTYTVTISGVTSYNDGDAFLVRFTNGNTTGCTLNINGLGAIALYRNNDGQLIGGDIISGAEMLCVYNSTTSRFQVIGTAPNTLLAYVTNADSVTITKGQPVYAFGGQGDRLTVKRAYNTSDATSAQTVGLVLSTSIGVNQKGLIMVNGLLDGLSILPTSTWADGDAVYLGATAGSITNVKPAAPNHLVYLGFVTTANNGSAGRMYVRVQNGYELQELHNVSIPTTPTDGQVLTYELSTSLWKAKTVSSTLTVGTTPIASGTIGRILFENGGNVLGQDSALFWDNTNKRLGVGATPATAVRLDVRAQGTLNTDISLRVRNSADTRDIFNVRGNKTIELLADTPATNGGISITANTYNEATINFYDNFTTNLMRIDAANALIAVRGNASIRIGSNITGDNYMGMVTPSTNNRFLKLVDAFGSEYLSIGGNTYDGTGGISMTLKTTTNNSTNFVTFSRSNNTNPVVINDQARVGIGTNSPQSRLDVRAQGALSTDIGFRVRNSADTTNLIEQRGNGQIVFSNTTSTYVLNPRTDADGFSLSSGSGLYGTGTGFEVVSNQFVIHNSSVRTFRFSGSSVSNFWVLHNESNQLRICPTTDTTQPTININNTNIIIGGLSVGSSATKTFAIYSGTAPSSSPVDAFQQYSADIVAGNAAPHFRTENGNIIKLFRGAALTASDGTLANAVTRIAELEARLQAHGLIA